ncbi:MAG: hypothetical protein H7833_00815 [Magnetococcus sp. DMHC-1]
MSVGKREKKTIGYTYSVVCRERTSLVWLDATPSPEMDAKPLCRPVGVVVG